MSEFRIRYNMIIAVCSIGLALLSFLLDYEYITDTFYYLLFFSIVGIGMFKYVDVNSEETIQKALGVISILYIPLTVVVISMDISSINYLIAATGVILVLSALDTIMYEEDKLPIIILNGVIIFIILLSNLLAIFESYIDIAYYLIVFTLLANGVQRLVYSIRGDLV